MLLSTNRKRISLTDRSSVGHQVDDFNWPAQPFRAPLMVTISFRLPARLRCSFSQSPCHWPRFSLPSVIGMVREDPNRLALMCAGMSSGPSQLCLNSVVWWLQLFSFDFHCNPRVAYGKRNSVRQDFFMKIFHAIAFTNTFHFEYFDRLSPRAPVGSRSSPCPRERPGPSSRSAWSRRTYAGSERDTGRPRTGRAPADSAAPARWPGDILGWPASVEFSFETRHCSTWWYLPKVKFA